MAFSSLKECEQYIDRINTDAPSGTFWRHFNMARKRLLNVTKATEEELGLIVNGEYIWTTNCAMERTIKFLQEDHLRRTEPTEKRQEEIGRSAMTWFGSFSLILAADRYNRAYSRYECAQLYPEKDNNKGLALDITEDLFFSAAQVASQYDMIAALNKRNAVSKIMADLGAKSGKKFAQAREVISEIAKERWDEGDNTSVGAIAEELMKFIEADPENLGLEEPPRLSTVVNWLRPIAPDHARKAGRPKKHK